MGCKKFLGWSEVEGEKTTKRSWDTGTSMVALLVCTCAIETVGLICNSSGHSFDINIYKKKSIILVFKDEILFSAATILFGMAEL